MEILDILKALSDETRIRMINLLKHEALCVCELEVLLDLSQSNASRHVTKLKNAKLVIGEKKAQWVYYRLDEHVLEKFSFLHALFNEDITRVQQCQTDMIRLRKHKKSGIGCEELIANKNTKNNLQ